MPTIPFRSPFKKNHFEKLAWSKNSLVCGLDEVGRGCLAGPIVTGAVILLPNKKSRLLKDSKLLTQEELLKAYRWITKNAWFSCSIMNHRDIDTFNIYQTTLKTMRRNIMQLFSHCPILPSTVVVDAMPVRLDNSLYEDIDIYYFAKGEQKSISIAAASIVAKVTRDQIMRILSRCFPGYHHERHKGYSTKKHQEAINSKGPSIIHRQRFLLDKHWRIELQQELFEEIYEFEQKQPIISTTKDN